MGDGQHIWAAAEWILMIRNCFVREDGEQLIIGSGILPRWLQGDTELCFGPAPTAFGVVTVEVRTSGETITVDWQADWHGEAPDILIRLPGMPAIAAEPGASSVEIERVVAA